MTAGNVDGHDLDRLLAVGHRAVDLAVQILRDRQVTSIATKIDRDFATDLDIAVERAVREFLATETPDIGFLGEEEGVTGDTSRTCWVLDPIDGTANFIHGIPVYGISLGLLVDGRPALGIIDFPALAERFAARSGGGATLNGRSIAVRDNADLARVIVTVGDFSTGPGAAPRNAAKARLLHDLGDVVERVRMIGSAAADLSWVAAGRTDACILLSNKPWDVTAGLAIAAAAGAVLLDASGQPHTTESGETIACAPGIATAIVRITNHATGSVG